MQDRIVAHLTAMETAAHEQYIQGQEEEWKNMKKATVNGKVK